ncbi:MAG: response regulator [Saprospiraceae bacterium]
MEHNFSGDAGNTLYEPMGNNINKILLIEDNPGDARLVEILLMESDLLDCEIEHRMSLGDGIEALKNSDDYGAILLDLTLPDSRGFETLERLLGQFPNNNVIVLTGLSDKSLGLKAVKAGAQDFLIKGAFDSDSLAKSLRYSIERSNVLQSLEDSRERYQSIFNQSRDAIYITDLVGKLIDFNPATAKLFSFSKEELEQIPNINQQYQDVANRNIFLDLLRRNGTVTEFPLLAIRRTGERRHCLVSATRIENDEGAGYNCIVRDITEQKMTEEMRKARDVARQSAQMKEQFIASISHEMRTPMNAILGMSNLMIQTELDGEQHEYVSSIKQSSEILLGIVNDILEISTIQNGKVVFEHEDFNLPQLLANLVNVMQYKIKEKDLYCEVKIDPKLPKFLKGDKLRLNQILYNLVGNAIKFTDDGHVKVHVTQMYMASKKNVHIKFLVEDTGIGIPTDKVDAIFESFTRVRQKDRIFEGTGLGLSIAKNLVEQQGGSIGATSELGVGSKFYFDLTFELGEAVEDVTKPPTKVVIDKTTPLRLLLAEDHKMNQIVARKTLEKQWSNIEITIANNGKEAIEILEKYSFDIILMDIQMPIMDGYEATDFIRKKMPKHIAQMPILAMTAHAHISKDEKFKQFGMDDFVLKPFEPQQLFEKIAYYVNRKSE